MKSLYKSLTFFLFSILLASLTACMDDPDLGISGDGSLEGEAMVSFDLQGMPLQSAMTRTNGNAVKNVRNLYVLFYKADGEENGQLAYAFTTDGSCGNDVFDKSLFITSTSEEDRGSFSNGSSDWNGSAESKTAKVKTGQVMVNRGKYRIYAVANVDDFSSSSFNSDKISTVEKLRNFTLRWNASDVSKNDGMFGFFTTSSTQGYDPLYEEGPVVSIASNNIELHSWVKRAVSKVTVAFDGTRLNDNVNVYIKKVSIKDIPSTCGLGAKNSPASMDQLITTGEQIVYASEDYETIGTRVSSREPYFPNFTGTTDDASAVNAWRQRVHSEDANALYFFENCQGESTGNPDENGSWKQQTDSNNNGKPDDYDKKIEKDTKTYGSYVEVEAYYTNENFGSQTKGHIIYRFMLGMNTTNDFNAHRNNHYKLTLCFKNNANDVDWHIDYSDQPGIYIPDIIYVSYTYNTASKLPIRVVGQTVSDLSLTINSSNWYPDDSSIPYFKGTTNPTGLPVGFLSLTYDDNPRVGRLAEDFDATLDAPKVQSYWNNQPNNTTRQYIRNGQKVDWADLNSHGYNVSTRTTSEGQTVFEMNIPMFTRPLVIYKICAWTGANPYFSSTRDAKIKLTGTVDGKAFSKDITVKQVRRIENPAGIYRSHNNADPFDVKLMVRNGEGGTHNGGAVSYQPLKSEGAWRAIVYRATTGTTSTTDQSDATAWFNITAGSQRINKVGEYLQGDAGTEINFTYAPNGTIAQNQVRTGIIKVEYNDYTCTHYIFVRQGYAPMQLESGRVYWHSFNLYSANEEVTSPCEAGSQFIRGYLSPAILDSNTAGWGVAVNSLACITNEAGTATGNISVPMANSGSYARKNFSSASRTLTRYNATLTPYRTGRIPSIDEWATLLNEVANAKIDRAYGVLYADGAKATQTNPVDVYGCLHSDVVGGTNGSTARGMRGTFVYNTGSGRNLFFPIGASGYGRRKVGDKGQLQYSFGNTFWSTPLETATRAPLYNLYTNEGAIYWAHSDVRVSGREGFNVDNVNAWDINYKSYDFDYMDSNSNGTPSAYLRLVQDTAP